MDATMYQRCIYPKNGFPPAGQYRGKVDEITVSKSKKTGSRCFDARCLIWNAQNNYYPIKTRIAVGTPYLDDLLDAFESLGIQIYSFEIKDMINENLNFVLAYDDDGRAHIHWSRIEEV